MSVKKQAITVIFAAVFLYACALDAFAASDFRMVWVDPPVLCPGQAFTVHYELKCGTNRTLYAKGFISANNVVEYSNTAPPALDWCFLGGPAPAVTGNNPPVAPGTWKIFNGSAVLGMPLASIYLPYTVSTTLPATFTEGTTINIIMETKDGFLGLDDPGDEIYVLPVQVQCGVNAVNNVAHLFERNSVPVSAIIRQCAMSPTSTITRTATKTSTVTITKTATPTGTATNTKTITQTSTKTNTATNTPTVTPTVSFTTTQTITPTSTKTSTGTMTPTFTPTVSFTSTGTITPTSTNTSTKTFTQTATPTVSFTNTATITPTSTKTDTKTVTQTATPTSTRTDTPTPAETMTNTQTRTPTTTRTSTPTASPTSTDSPVFTFTVTLTATETATPTFTRTQTKTVTETGTSTNTPSVTLTITETAQLTWTITPTLTQTVTPTFTRTVTNTVTDTSTVTNTPSVTMTITETAQLTWTVTPTMTQTITPTRTKTETRTITVTFTDTITPTITFTITDTVTRTYTPTVTLTSTDTPMMTFTVTPSATWTITVTLTPTPSATVTLTPTPQPADIEIIMIGIDTTGTAGGTAELKVTVRNIGGGWARGVALSDLLPNTVDFEITGSAAGWNADLSGNISLTAGDIAPGAYVELRLMIRIKDSVTADSVTIPAMQADYTDDAAPLLNITRLSQAVLIKLGEIQVFPNPFNPAKAKDGKLKFLNLPRATNVFVYTVSGELVIMWQAMFTSSVLWDGKNMFGKEVSTGVYYYVIQNEDKKIAKTGKLFIYR